MTAIAVRWLRDGTVDRLEGEKRADARGRQAIARDVLGDLNRLGHPSSYYLWLPLPEQARADRVAADLLTQHVCVATAEPFSISAAVPQAIRLALGSADIGVLAATLNVVKEAVEAEIYR
jgi:DNA-binding transcriptional MocR family regulator